MKDIYMTHVIKPAGLVEFPRSITINGTAYTVELVANGHVPAAHDIAEQFIKDNVADIQARSEAGEDVDFAGAEVILNQMQNHKEYSYYE